MAKAPDAFRTISEVAEWLGVQAHVLRFWESKFSQVKPVKRAGGRRYYRPADMLLLGGIKKLLHDDGLTIKGVQKLLKDEGIDHVARQSQELDTEGSTEATSPDKTDGTDTPVSLQQGAPETGEPPADEILSGEIPSEETVTDAALPEADAVMEADRDPDDWSGIPQTEPHAEPTPQVGAGQGAGDASWSVPELPEAHAPLIGIPDDMRPAEEDEPAPEEAPASDSLPTSLLAPDDDAHSAAPAEEKETPSLFSRRMPQPAEPAAEPDPAEASPASDQPDLLSVPEDAEAAALPTEDAAPEALPAAEAASPPPEPVAAEQPAEEPAPEHATLAEDEAAAVDVAPEAAPEDVSADDTEPLEATTPEAGPENAEPQDTEPQDAGPQDTEAPDADPQDPGSGALPSFLTRPDAPTPPEPETPRARAIDAPDPAQDDDLRPAPGVLSHLAQIDRLSAEQAKALAPLAEDLRAVSARLLQRSSG